METVVLKNGAEEARALVTVGMISIESLAREYPMIFYELVMLARDRNHELFGRAGEELRNRALIGPGNHMHDSLRNIVMSAVTGEGMDMVLGNPITITIARSSSS